MPMRHFIYITSETHLLGIVHALVLGIALVLIFDHTLERVPRHLSKLQTQVNMLYRVACHRTVY